METADNLYFKDVFDKTLNEIATRLNVAISGIHKQQKIYASKLNSFVIDTKSLRDGTQKSYFLKFQNPKHTRDELAGHSFLKNTIPTPNIILISDEYSWILYECISGDLMAEKMLKAREDGFKHFLDLEREKEFLLEKLHRKESWEIDFNSYLHTRTNKLFCDRLLGEQFKSFYFKDTIGSLFDRKIEINGRKFPNTTLEILGKIRERLNQSKNKRVSAIMGHGDAHHGNIIIEDGIWFIDSEYADIIPPYMEMAKPYYNDFIGTLFFHHQDQLKEYFEVVKLSDSNGVLCFEISCRKPMSPYLDITKVKIESRKETCNQSSDDFLTLNQYLILCHMLTKNPNAYSEHTKMLFVAFIALLDNFDPFRPDSIYDLLQQAK
jgi:hypothetical protein